jgi:hypothetical protein
LPGHMPEPVNPLTRGPGLPTYRPGPFRCGKYWPRAMYVQRLARDASSRPAGATAADGARRVVGLFTASSSLPSFRLFAWLAQQYQPAPMTSASDSQGSF